MEAATIRHMDASLALAHFVTPMSPSPSAPSPSHILRVHGSPINSVSFSDDNERLYSGDASGFVAVSSTRTLRPIASWKAHTDGLLGVQEWEDTVITHGRDNKLHVWDKIVASTSVGDSASVNNLPMPSLRYSMDVNALNFCRFCIIPMSCPPDSAIQAALIAVPNLVDSSLADIWSLPSCDRLHAAIGKRGLSGLNPHSDGRGDAKTGILMSLHLHDAKHPFSSGRTQLHLLAGYESGSVILWRYDNAGRAVSIEGLGWVSIWNVTLHVESVMAMTVERDFRFALTTSADHLVGRYDLRVSESDQAEDGHHTTHRIKQAGNGAIAMRDDGKVCGIGGWDGRVRLFSAKSMKSLGTLTYHTGACQAIAFAHQSHGCNSGDDDDDDDDGMTQGERVARSRWMAVGGSDHRLSIWELMSFERT